jgi:hypothetical protein
MPKPLPEGLPRSRYSYEAVVIEIRRKLGDEGVSHKSAAAACKLSDTGFSQRLRGEESWFKVEHLGAIADALKAPPGWPLIPWELADQMAAALKRKRHNE